MANPAYPRWRDWLKCVGENGENYIDANNKALAEKAVDHCETWVLAPLAGERFGTLSELNAAASELVDALNARPHSNREGSRDDAFLGGERAALNPLPPAHLEARSLWTREWFE